MCKGLEIVVCKSNAGYYKGTRDSKGYANCRVSSQYEKTAEEAEKLPLDRMTCAENIFCNKTGNCLE